MGLFILSFLDEITEQAPFLQAASENLGTVDRILAMCISFWSSIGAACQKMKKQMDVPQAFLKVKKAAMMTDKEMQQKFVKIFDKGARVRPSAHLEHRYRSGH